MPKLKLGEMMGELKGASPCHAAHTANPEPSKEGSKEKKKAMVIAILKRKAGK